MGTYLSTPASEKYKEWGDDTECPLQTLRFALVDMQGWRKSMEDAHVVELTVPYPPLLPYLDSKEKDKIPKAKVFGVFDGHGGPEVARFCQLYMVSVLTQQKLWKLENPEEACDQADESEKTDIGDALIKTFHALDRMVDDPGRRDELIRLRTTKAPPTERREAVEIPPETPVVPFENGITKVTELVEFAGAGEAPTNMLPPPSPPPPPPTNIPLAESTTPSAAVAREEGKDTVSSTKDVNDENKQTADGASVASEITTEDSTASEDSTADTADNTAESKEEEANSDDSGEQNSKEDDDSDEAVGKEEAAKLDQDLEEDDNNDNDVQINPYDGAGQEADAEVAEPVAEADAPNKVAVMFQRLLNMNETPPESGQVVVQVAGDAAQNVAAATPALQPVVRTGPSAALPSILQNGRLICNLPDHPIHAGCTAVVAVMLGMTLTIANAGDSRGVLCREGGITEPLSYDHKPSQPREMNRINNAGGFVNRFGRVNGNLNLSRSIGDLKYKQVPGISPAGQMITAQPDIIQVTLNPKDEFFVLGCDGIWDCLTNEKCVEFVRERIDTMEPKDIGSEMLGSILSDDPRATQGIGGDNMTILIVDLQPASRSYTIDPAWGPETASSL